MTGKVRTPVNRIGIKAILTFSALIRTIFHEASVSAVPRDGRGREAGDVAHQLHCVTFLDAHGVSGRQVLDDLGWL